jgi:hypothetical protein
LNRLILFHSPSCPSLSFFVAQSFWLLLEIIDIVTDFIAVDNVLKYSFLSRYFTIYIVLVSLATVLSVIVIYYRSRALYDVRF